MTGKLDGLNTRAKLEKRINLLTDKFISDSLKNALNGIVKTLELDLSRNLETHCKSYIKMEKEHIESCLDGPNFFNLSGKPVKESTKHLLGKGGKYIPYVYVKPCVKKELFTEEFCEIVNNFIKFIAPGSKQIKRLTLRRDIKKLISYFKNNEMQSYADLVRSIFAKFKVNRQLYADNQSIHARDDEKKIKEGFKNEKGAIFIESDKGVGYTYIQVSDLKEQYHSINSQQHFVQVRLDEEKYLSDIKDFIKSAKDNLPRELSGIIKPKDFISENKKEGLGALRLMPKILKLKKIDRSEIKNLKCRGIKSSMGDPITVIQKILDKLFNHVLHFQEKEFVKRFGFSSPSVTGVKEAGERIRASTTGPWGSSIEIEGDFREGFFK